MIRCSNCKQEYPETGFPHRCKNCGGIFDFEIDSSKLDKPDQNRDALWKYRETFDLPKGGPLISLGEGDTPLSWVNYRKNKIGLKLEFLNPTASYKDRGSTVLVSHLAARRIGEAVEDSSGNAGASFAAYAARAGIKAGLYIPESASGPKRKQIEWYGADVHRIGGPRAEAAKAVLKEVEQGSNYASHAWQPFGLAGIATIAYEIAEQIGTDPGSIIAPVGHGGLLYGIIKGFKALQEIGRIRQLPYFVGAQSAACDPVVRLSLNEVNPFTPKTKINTIAEGVKVIDPARGEALINNLADGRGEFLSINDDELKKDHLELARLGYFVEPTSALAWSAVKEKAGQIPEPIVAVLTGSGLKYS